MKNRKTKLRFVFWEKKRIESKNLILQIFRTHGDIENYAPSKFQPRTTLGGAKNVKKTKKKLEFFMILEFSFSSFLMDFGGARLFLTSKSSSSRFFALDGQFFRSVWRLEVIFGFFTVRTSTCDGNWGIQIRQQLPGPRPRGRVGKGINPFPGTGLGG